MVTHWAGVPKIDRVLYYDDCFLFVSALGHTASGTEVGIYVHSRKHDRWFRVERISTKDGVFGHSFSEVREDQQKLVGIPVSWDFRGLAEKSDAVMPLRASQGGPIFPDQFKYDEKTKRYRLGFMTGAGVESAATFLYILRSDLETATEE